MTLFCNHQSACEAEGPFAFGLEDLGGGSASMVPPRGEMPVTPLSSPDGQIFYLVSHDEIGSVGLLTLFEDGSFAIGEHFHYPNGSPQATLSHGTCTETQQ